MLSNPAPPPRSLSGGDRAIIIGLAALAALVAGVWLTGELAALLASGTTVSVGPAPSRACSPTCPTIWPTRRAPGRARPARAPRPSRLLRRRGARDRHRARAAPVVAARVAVAALGARGRGGPPTRSRRALGAPASCAL